MDRYGRRGIRVPTQINDLQDSAGILTRVQDFLRQGDDTAKVKLPNVTIHTMVEDVYSAPRIRKGFPSLLKVLESCPTVNLLFHFSCAPDDWKPFLQWLSSFSSLREGGGRNHVFIHGPFALLDESIKEWMISIGIHLGYRVGWPQECDNDCFEIIRDLAHFGFTVPLILYVHVNNIKHVPSLIPAALRANQYSGIALPLILSHPQYEFKVDQPGFPEEDAYLQLLTQVYRDYPFLDKMFLPIRELAERVRDGGWCRAEDVPADLQLLVSAKGVLVFRQIPAFAKPWAPWDEIMMVEGTEALSSLLSLQRAVFGWGQNPFCQSCSWRHLCGGIDVHADEPIPTGAAELACGHRKFFLEAFVPALST